VIVLVRHADTDWLDRSSSKVLRDPPLSARGRDQLPHLWRFLGTCEFERFVYSPLLRVVETLEHAEAALCCLPEPARWLEEIRYPDWEGREPETIFGLLENMDGADVHTRWQGFEGGESLRTYTKRVRRGACAFLQNYWIARGSAKGLWRVAAPAQAIGMLGHAGSLSIITSMLLGLPPVAWERQRFLLRQCSVTQVGPVSVGSEYAFGVIELGRDDFIPPDLRSAT
jgi:broad specificity phosphatase PhoE